MALIFAWCLQIASNLSLIVFLTNSVTAAIYVAAVYFIGNKLKNIKFFCKKGGHLPLSLIKYYGCKIIKMAVICSL